MVGRGAWAVVVPIKLLDRVATPSHRARRGANCTGVVEKAQDEKA